MSNIDDGERRKIAQSLRDSWKQTWHGEKMMHRLRIALGIGHEVSTYGKFRYYRAVAERLADLIEPPTQCPYYHSERHYCSVHEDLQVIDRDALLNIADEFDHIGNIAGEHELYAMRFDFVGYAQKIRDAVGAENARM